jgi:hypothetical protein
LRSRSRARAVAVRGGELKRNGSGRRAARGRPRRSVVVRIHDGIDLDRERSLDRRLGLRAIPDLLALELVARRTGLSRKALVLTIDLRSQRSGGGGAGQSENPRNDESTHPPGKNEPTIKTFHEFSL